MDKNELFTVAFLNKEKKVLVVDGQKSFQFEKGEQVKLFLSIFTHTKAEYIKVKKLKNKDSVIIKIK